MDTIYLHVGGLVGAILALTPYCAITFGQHIYFRDYSVNPDILDHELIHVEQYKRYGFIGFLIRYIYYLLKYGYYNNPLEVEARERS